MGILEGLMVKGMLLRWESFQRSSGVKVPSRWTWSSTWKSVSWFSFVFDEFLWV